MANYTLAMGDDGIATITLDTQGKPVNVIDADFIPMMEEILGCLDREANLRGVIITSAKSTFFAGGDINMLASIDDPLAAFDVAQGLKDVLRRLETLGKPVIAAMNGSALGGGLEIALACHGRVAMRGEKTRFGLPEVGLGLLPGAGGVVRTTRMLGLKAALPFLMSGRAVDADTAQEMGLVDLVVDDTKAMMAAARALIDSHPSTSKPWDERRERIPGGNPYLGAMPSVISGTYAATVKAAGKDPAPHAILAAATEGAAAGFASACKIESRYFAQLCISPEAKTKLAAFLAR